MKRKRATKAEIEQRLKLLKEEGVKYCSNCDTTKPAEDFAEDKRHYDGLQTYCRECSNLLRRTKWGDKVRATAREAHHEKKEENNARCLSYYYENREHLCQKMKGWRAANIDHRREYRRQYHLDHYEEENEVARIRAMQWFRDNPERHRENCRRRELRQREAEGSHELEEWKYLLDMCGNVCLDCGETEDITRDHIIPLAWGGTDDLTNIQPLCKSCNCKKQDHYAADYRPAYVRAWAHFQSYPLLEAA